MKEKNLKKAIRIAQKLTGDSNIPKLTPYFLETLLAVEDEVKRDLILARRGLTEEVLEHHEPMLLVLNQIAPKTVQAKYN